jgi:hypothetical protein
MTAPRDVRDWCQVAGCRKESDIIYLGVGLCDGHWCEACQYPTVGEFLQERLAEAALLEVNWT